jgi:hypothetical protein
MTTTRRETTESPGIISPQSKAARAFHITMIGGLGNQLFQLAHVLRLRRMGLEVSYGFSSFGTPRAFGLDWFNVPPPLASTSGDGAELQPLKHGAPQWWCRGEPIWNYWQDMPLSPVFPELRAALVPARPDDAQTEDLVAAFIGRAVVFVRRGDREREVTTDAFYHTALAGRGDALIVTDDEPWAARHLQWLGAVCPSFHLHPALVLWAASHAEHFVFPDTDSSFGRWAEHIKRIHSADGRL